MKSKYYFVLFLLFNIAQAQNSYVSRALAVLDLTQKNAETNNSNLFSVEHIVKTMGIPYLTTKNLSEAIKYPVILATSDFLDNTFNTAELNTLTNYVNNGGVLIATNIASSKYYSLFGISGYSTSTKRYSLNWIDPSNDSALRWIDDSLELTISLGSKNYENVISSRSYLLSNSTALAFYDDNTVAAGKNNYGAGSTYFFGISWRMIILFNQFNYDYEAQRIWSEGFEPTSDVVMLFVKGIYAKHVSFAIWKHTAPYDNKAVMIMTHDIDWGQAFDTMRLCADLEKKYKIKTEYFVTTHYIRDDEDPDYYSDSIADVIYVKEQGMKIGSHSVGHFRDFSKSSIFPIGSPGNTKENYYPQYLDGVTKNGTCFGECEVSKNLLEQDCGANIRSFRSGFLAFNPNQILVLDSLGYDFNSTQSACDVLTHFPYQQHKEQSFSGRLSRIYEIPLTIDADPVTQENWRSLIDYHLTLIDKIKANNAIINILVHPGRLPKIWYVENLLQRLPKDVFVMNLEDFGDYWKDREVFDFTSTVNNNIMTLSIPDNELPVNPYFALIINNGKNLSDIVVKSQSGSIIQYFKSDFDTNDIVIYFGQPQNTEITILQQPQSQNQCIGNSFPLKVDVSALPPIKYQWYKNNILIQGATGEIYEIKNATNVDAGIYYCLITNEYSHINSNTSKININQIDNTEIKPKEGQSFYYSQDSTLYFCNPIELQIKTLPGADFSYQWFKETDLIAGATNTIFQVSESALYSLEITNSSGCRSKSNILNLVKPENLKAKLSITGSESFCSGQTATLYTKEISNESFESGNFNEFNWQSSGDQVWMIDNSNKYVGSYSAKSGLITHLQSSILTISQYVEKDTEIGFAYRVSSETNYDFLRFYINGKLKGEWSGEVEWTSILFSVNRGYNEFRWVYSKDKSVNTGSDAAWIDNIDFPAKATGLLTYQWYKNNSLINNSTNSLYNIGETGNYYVRVNNNCNIFNSGHLSIEVYQKPEAIITYQGNAEICEGKNLMLDANIKQKENFETADFNKYNWQHTGALNWNIYNLNNKINLGYNAAKSGNITHNQTSELSLILNVTEADSISFYSKVSSETNYDYLKFYINDVKLAEWSGEVDWAKVAFAVNPGLNTFKWVYSKDNSVNTGEDAAFIDNVVLPIFVSTGKPSYQWFKDGNIIQGATYYQYLAFNTGTYSVQVANNCGSKLSESLNIGLFNPNVYISTSGSANLCPGASVLLSGVNYTDVGYQWKINNNDIPGASNSSFLAEKQGDYSYELTNSNGCSKVSDILPVRLNKVPVLNIYSQGGTQFCEGSNILLKAKSIDKEDFETANLNSYSWLSNGNALWIPDNSSYYSGKWSAKSGVITHLQTTSLSITLNVIANDTISFYRKVSSEKNYDFIRFYINDVLKGEWSGELDWTKFSYPVSSGITSFKWVYSKDKSVNKYSDAAWIDNIIFPHFESANQVYYQWVLNNEDIPAATNSIYNPLTSGIYKLKAYNFCGEYLTNEIKILSGQVPIAQISADGITNFCSDASVILNGTLPENENFETSDFSKYNWQHSGILQWSVTNLNSIENNYCAKSGAITHNQTSELIINFNTLIADSISFYRKISSESSYDFLSFYINDIKAGEWSGEINWSRVVFSVSPGANTFKWIYSKDKSVNTGLDCAWIDKIIFPAQQAEKLKYQWTRNSFDIAGATNYFYNAKQAGTYNVKVSNNCGISTSSSIIVSVSSTSQITINATGSLSFCVGGSVNLFCQNSGLNSPQYQWLRNGVNINGATGSSYIANSSGIYTLNVVSASCSSLSNSQTVTVVTTPEIKVYSQGTTVCNGSLVKLTSKPIAVEDFNSNNFNQFNWYFAGNQPWRLSTTTPYEGKYNAKSGTITHNQSTELILNYDVLANDTISFYIKVSSESNYDFAKFYINNELKGQWSGTMDYTLIKIPVNSGNNTFKWLYTKDRSVSTGSDCIWLDKITFPATVSSAPYSYQWQLNGTNINGATNSVYNANIAGSYSVILNNLCTSAKSSSINITSNCKILSLTDDNIFKYMVYVDNVNNLLNINLSSDLQEKLSIKIYNSLGKICYQDENIIFSDSYNKVVNISNYAKGIYNVNIYRGDKVYCHKLIF